MNKKTLFTMTLAATLTLTSCGSKRAALTDEIDKRIEEADRKLEATDQRLEEATRRIDKANRRIDEANKRLSQRERTVIIDGDTLKGYPLKALEALKGNEGLSALSSLESLKELEKLKDVDFSQYKTASKEELRGLSDSEENTLSKNKDAVTRTLDLPAFTSIKANTAVTITYTQGSKRQVVVTAPAKLMDELEFAVKEGWLSVNLKNGQKQRELDNMRCSISITCPTISQIHNNSAMTFTAQSMECDELKVRNNGALKLRVATLKCGVYSQENNGALNVKGDISAREVRIHNTSALTHNGNITGTELVNIDNYGSSKLTCSVKTPSFSLNCWGADTDELDIQGGDATFYNPGAGRISGTFKGNAAHFKNLGSCKIDMTFDCKELEAESNGASKMVLHGTADNTKIKSLGNSTIDATELNKF